MLFVLKNTWALLLGILLLMIGNGLQGTLLGVRGDIEGFGATEMSLVMSAYFVGFLGGSRLTPILIRNVGHVRVFAALASFISAAFILYGALPSPIAWIFMRMIVGFCFSGVYVVAESWLNDSAPNHLRGQALSLYMIVQMIGIVSAQFLMTIADPGGYTLFVVISVLVSVSFAPILLSISPAPVFNTTKAMTLRELYNSSPLGVVGIFFMGALFSAMFGMSSVYGAARELTIPQISFFVAMIYIGGFVMQYPIGWLSDRMDRRVIIAASTLFVGAALIIGFNFAESYQVLLLLAFLFGGIGNPLYSLLLAYTNDFLDPSDYAAASGGLLFVNGIGAIMGPITIGWLMERVGPNSYFLVIAALFIAIGLYAVYRMTQRATPEQDETAVYTFVTPQASAVAVELATEVAIEAAEEAADEGFTESK